MWTQWLSWCLRFLTPERGSITDDLRLTYVLTHLFTLIPFLPNYQERIYFLRAKQVLRLQPLQTKIGAKRGTKEGGRERDLDSRDYREEGLRRRTGYLLGTDRDAEDPSDEGFYRSPLALLISHNSP